MKTNSNSLENKKPGEALIVVMTAAIDPGCQIIKSSSSMLSISIRSDPDDQDSEIQKFQDSGSSDT